VTDHVRDRLSPALSLTPDERASVRALAERDSVSLLSAAYAAALGQVEHADELIERMIAEARR
jgi:hypothetical protein